MVEWRRSHEGSGVAGDRGCAALLPAAAEPVVGDDGPRGIKLAKEGRCSEAMPLLRNAAAVDSGNAELFYQMGRCQNQSGDFEPAARNLSSAISRNSKRADFFVERALSFAAQKQSQRALDDVDQALRLDPANLEAEEARGDIAMLMGNYGQ